MATRPPKLPERVHHLVSPRSHGKPLCGETASDPLIGAYSEHLDESEQWCRVVFGMDGKAGKACDGCLALYPSLLWGRAERFDDQMTLQTLVTISPYPQSMRDSFTIKGHCLSEDFSVQGEPAITGPYVRYGKVALTFITHVMSKSPEELRTGDQRRR